jgi:ubiquinone/menaquinone biosynthesis C-methylase UbiE
MHPNKTSLMPALTPPPHFLCAADDFSFDAGVWQHRAWKQVGVTEQFLEEAGIYHERYFARTDFDELIARVLAQTALDRQAACQILDLGSGGGSSVFAFARAFPNANVVATDISPQLLGILMKLCAQSPELEKRICAVCVDVHEAVFAPRQFDLIFGAAILHHLVSPYEALVNTTKSLKPGCDLAVIEPLEAGSAILMLLFERVQNLLARKDQQANPAYQMCVAMRTDIQARFGPERLKPWSAVLDDKWVFDESYLWGLAKRLNFEDLEISPLQQDLTNVYASAFYSTATESGVSHAHLDDDVRGLLADFDRSFSLDFKTANPPTGAIVFRRYIGT